MTAGEMFLARPYSIHKIAIPSAAMKLNLAKLPFFTTNEQYRRRIESPLNFSTTRTYSAEKVPLQIIWGSIYTQRKRDIARQNQTPFHRLNKRDRSPYFSNF